MRARVCNKSRDLRQDRDSRQEGGRALGGERVGFGGTHGSGTELKHSALGRPAPFMLYHPGSQDSL